MSNWEEMNRTENHNSTMRCRKCGRYGRVLRHVTVQGNDGKAYQPCEVVTCVYCHTIEGFVNERHNQLPLGVNKNMLERAMRSEPIRLTWTQQELMTR